MPRGPGARDTVEAMSQENVAVVRATFEAWNAGDEAALGVPLHADAVLQMPEGWPEPGPYVGREAVMRQWKQQRETWDVDSLEVVGEFMDTADKVAVRFIWHAAGHGPEAQIEVTGVYTVREGKIRTIRFFRDHAEALEAAGLS
jgi:ketosteroid isomerase-like protein